MSHDEHVMGPDQEAENGDGHEEKATLCSRKCAFGKMR